MGKGVAISIGLQEATQSSNHDQQFSTKPFI